MYAKRDIFSLCLFYPTKLNTGDIRTEKLELRRISNQALQCDYIRIFEYRSGLNEEILLCISNFAVYLKFCEVAITSLFYFPQFLTAPKSFFWLKLLLEIIQYSFSKLAYLAVTQTLQFELKVDHYNSCWTIFDSFETNISLLSCVHAKKGLKFS